MATQVIQKSFFSLLLILSVNACAWKGQSMNTNEKVKKLDQAFQVALQNARSMESVEYYACGRHLDYRYGVCFDELTGSAAVIMKKMRDILVDAGFETHSIGNMDGELSGVFILPNTPYELNSTFDSRGIQWIVYENNRGRVAPLYKIDDPKAPYALRSTKDFAESRVALFVRIALSLKKGENDGSQFESCGEATEESASYCVKPLLTQKQVIQALTDIYFAGDEEEFDRLNTKETFVYRQEKRMKRLKEQGTVDEDYESDLTVTKIRAGLYTATNWRDYPAYKITCELTPKGDKYAVKVTATRIPIHPKAQKKEGE